MIALIVAAALFPLFCYSIYRTVYLHKYDPDAAWATEFDRLEYESGQLGRILPCTVVDKHQVLMRIEDLHAYVDIKENEVSLWRNRAISEQDKNLRLLEVVGKGDEELLERLTQISMPAGTPEWEGSISPTTNAKYAFLSTRFPV